jgi:hypothetical protein
MEAHSQETLAHVHDRLDRGGGSGLIDDGPGARLKQASMARLGQISRTKHPVAGPRLLPQA